jgi:hypothetical protein
MAVRHAGVSLTRIGSWTAEPQLRLRATVAGTPADRELPAVGYDHFR